MVRLALSVVCFYIFLFHLVQSTTEQDLAHYDDLDQKCNLKDEQFETQEILWFTNMPSLPHLLQNSDTLPDGKCKEQLELYFKFLKNGTLWAVEMFDASVKSMYGIIAGHTRHLGNFEQCYRIATKISGQEDELRSRYCLVEIQYKEKNEPPSTPNKYLDLFFEPQESVWEAIRERGDFRRVQRYLLQLALCVPSSCQAKDIENVLRSPLLEFGDNINLNISLAVDDKDCISYTDTTSISIYGQLFCLIIVLWVTIILFCTYYDISFYKDKKPKGTMVDLIKCLSIRNNYTDIFSASYSHRGLDSIHALRVVFMVLIILYHSGLTYLWNPVVDPRIIELSFTKRWFTIFHSASVLTDAFLGMSGLLTAYNLLQEVEKNKKLNYFRFIITKYMRLTPVYAIVVFFNGLIFSSTGEGPYWKQHVNTRYEKYCTSNWWTNLLYINNYVNPEEMCMMQSWYLTVNFHGYLLTPLIMYFVLKVPRKIGYSSVAALIFLSTIPSFVTTYYYNVNPGFVFFPHDFRELTYYFYNYYIKTHLRLTSYLVGLITGVFLYDYNFAKWRLPKIWSQILIIILGPVLGLPIILMTFNFWDPNTPMTHFEQTLYAGMHRGAFAFSICSIIVLLTVGDGLDVHYKLMNCRWMQPLSKLTYCAYIVHVIIQTYFIATAQTARTATYFNLLLWNPIPELLWCFVMSLVLAITVEVPFRKLEKQFIFKRYVKVESDRKMTIDSNTIKKND